MRVIVFTQQLAAYRSGVGAYAHALVTGLAGRGHEVTVVTPKDEEMDIPGVGRIAVPGPRLDPTPGGWLTLGRSFAAVLQDEAGRFDVAHFADAREAYRVRRPRIPVTAMVNDSYALDWLRPDYPRGTFADRRSRACYYAFLRFVEKRTLGRLDGLIANSRHVASAVTDGYGLAPDQTTVVNIGLPEPAPVPPVPLAGSPSVLFVGGNFQRKGLPSLLAALSRLRADLPYAHLHVVGRDRNQPAMAALAGRLGLAGAVTFHGWQPNERVRGMMAGAGVFALPSLTEGFGLVYIEAMRAGAPVVATAVGGASEVFEDGVEALFVRPGDVESLASALRRLATDPVFRSRIVEEGRRAAGRLTVGGMVEGTERVFLSVLGDACVRHGAKGCA